MLKFAPACWVVIASFRAISSTVALVTLQKKAISNEKTPNNAYIIRKIYLQTGSFGPSIYIIKTKTDWITIAMNR